MSLIGLDKLRNIVKIVYQNGGILGTMYKIYRQDDIKFGQYVGADHLGNKYYENPYYFIGKSRWVEFADRYKLEYDASHITSQWYGWLHYKTDYTPDKDPGRPCYKWMMLHEENLTGTTCQYYPYSTTREKIKPWIPMRRCYYIACK